MCGIFGVWHFDGRPVDVENLHRATRAMAHRGPDDEGYLLADSRAGRALSCSGTDTDRRLPLPAITGHYAEKVDFAAGFRRLSILDLSPAGHQPMCSPDGRYWILFNGEVYNFLEQRRHLEEKGVVFTSNSDTEVILGLYAAYGPDCVRYLRGMFSFVVWDVENRTIFGARDHFGIKPFLYSLKDGRFVFSSEIKTLLASKLVDKAIDHVAVQEFLLLGSIQPPATILRQVSALLPGQYLLFDGTELVIKTYWDVAAGGEEEFSGSYGEACDHLADLLRLSVEEQMVSDVPLGAFLSGGLDSAAVVAFMKSRGKLAERIKTFTIGFEDPAITLDESSQAADTARFLDTEHRSLLISDRDVMDAFDHFSWSLDQPSIDGLNTYFVSRFARQEVTVALSGLGGDEVFGGYSRVWRMLRSRPSVLNEMAERALAPAMVRTVLSRLPGSLDRRLQILAAQKRLSGQYAYSRILFWPEDLSGAFSPGNGFQPGPPPSIENALLKHGAPAYKDLLRQASWFELKTFMSAQLLRDMDAVSMAHSLEVRFPLIDPRIVSFGFSLPASFKFSGRKMSESEKDASTYAAGVKRVLFDAVKADLPAGVGDRRKAGFKLPYGRWLTGGLARELEGLFLSDDVLSPFTPSWRKSALNKFKAGRFSGNQMWTLFVLQKWYANVFEA